MIDVTSHIHMEQAVRDNDACFHALADSLQVCVGITDTRRVLYTNRYQQHFLGYSAEELQRMPPMEIFAPEFRLPLLQRAADRMRGLPAPNTYECQMFTRSGQRRWVEMSPVHFENCGHQAILAVAVDIEHRKQMEEKLRQVNRSLGQRVAEHTVRARQRREQLQHVSSQLAQAETLERQRLARILHDNLQQLIFSAKLRMPIIRKAPALDRPHVEALEQAESLLQQAMGAARNLSVELNPPSLRQGLLSSLRWLAQWMLDHYRLGVTVSVDAATRRADPTTVPQQTTMLLFQAVREMLFNVAKHAQTPCADIRVTRTNSHLRLAVRDEGRGFDPRTLADKPRSSFGLSSIQERIEILGGQMDIASQPDKGTTITVTAPLPRRHKAKTTRKKTTRGRGKAI